MRTLVCSCGETEIETSLVGDPPKCLKCMQCYSTLSDLESGRVQSEPHKWEEDEDGESRTCTVCMSTELNEPIVQKEYAMIFKNQEGEWINNKGEVIADKLVEQYNIKGRFLRDGTFDERDDIRSLEI